MADDSKGGATTAIVVAVIGLIGVLGAAYIASGKWHGPHTPPVNSAAISTGSNSNSAIGNGSNSNGSNSNGSNSNSAGGSGVIPPPHMSVIVGNTSYSGSDYTQLSTDSALQCSDDCLAQTQCRAMTYATSTHTCWLKTAVPAAQHGSDFSAAYKVDG